MIYEENFNVKVPEMRDHSPRKKNLLYITHVCTRTHLTHTTLHHTHTKQAKQSLWLILAVMSTQWETIQVLRVSARKSSLGSTGNLYHVSQMRVRAPKVA